MRLLLDHDADPNLPEEQVAPKGKALYAAVYPGENWPTREYNWLHISPLHQAARDGDLNKVRQLVDAGAVLTTR